MDRLCMTKLNALIRKLRQAEALALRLEDHASIKADMRELRDDLCPLRIRTEYIRDHKPCAPASSAVR